MPSSTSSSKASRIIRLDRFTILLLSTVALVLGLTEAITAWGFDRTSKVQRREVAQRRELLRVHDLGNGDDPHVAVLGNSLMLEGVDMSLLASKINPGYTPVPYFVLATNYYDWYFGLKRLFAEGMRPHYIVLGLSPNQLAAPEIRGDYSAHYLFQQSDLLDVVHRTHMDPTTASGFILSHYSEFYSTRDVTRGFVLNRVLPSVEQLLHNHLGTFRDPEIVPEVLAPLSSRRLSELDQLCRSQGSRFVFVVPPSYQKGAETIVQAGQNAGVAVLVPVPNEEFDASYYQSDGFHLNDKGAQVFTTRLAGALLEDLPVIEQKQITASKKQDLK